MSSLRFDITHRSSVCKARLGRVHTPHGVFDTPAFMPVGTRGTVKGVLPHLVAQTGAQIILGNTYHLLLRPGPETVKRLGGLQRFAGWAGPMLTDSGGYQAYSMADINRVTDDGVTFKSVVDGSEVMLNPERAMRVQNDLGADIIMAFDDCPPSVDPTAGDGAARPVSRRERRYDHAERLKTANERTVRWLERCKQAHARPDEQALFGIVQGGTDLDQRTWSAQRICNIELPGYAIGGVAVGETTADIARVVRHTAPLLPDEKPRYLMGVGYDRDLVAAVRAGVDMFDCVLPTRNGRNANAFVPTGNGQMRLRNARYAEDPGPIEEGCDCLACRWALTEHEQNGKTNDSTFSRAYIRHLFMAKEMLGPILVSLHNLRYFQRLMADLRGTIVSGDWDGMARRFPAAFIEGPREIGFEG